MLDKEVSSICSFTEGSSVDVSLNSVLMMLWSHKN